MAQFRQCSNGRNMVYQTIDTECEFIDEYRQRVFFVRNCLLSQGLSFPVVKIANRCLAQVNICRLIISRNIEVLGDNCFELSKIVFLARESDSHLRYCGRDAFAFVRKLAIFFVLDIVAPSSSSSSQDLWSRDIESCEDGFWTSVLGVRMYADCSSLSFICIQFSVTICPEVLLFIRVISITCSSAFNDIPLNSFLSLQKST
jgi:hypothetical protein